MIKNPTVLVTGDLMLKDNFILLTEKLQERGVNVITGPETIRGSKKVYSDEEIAEYFNSADVIMFSPRSLGDRRLLAGCKNALGIVYPGVGLETLDIAAATEFDIAVGYGPVPENIISVAEYAVALIIMSAHHILPGIASTYGKYELNRGRVSTAVSVYGKKVGFLGFGRIGREVARRLQPFGVEMLAYSPSLTRATAPDYVRVCTKEEVIRESDFLGLYVVINNETYHMINKQTLSMMKPTAFLINTARGEAVDERDLYEALVNKTIAGAALDTYNREPLPADSRLRELDNVILTPHIAANTVEQYYGSLQAEIDNILNILDGKLPVYCKNPEIEERWREKYVKRNSGNSLI